MLKSEEDTQPVVKPELGTKRSCPSCQTRFYDLGKEEIVCPNCGVTFVPEQLLPSKADQAAPKPRVVAEPAAVPEAEAEPDAIKAETGEAGEDDVVEDVVEDTELAEEDEFLEEVEEDAEVSDLIGGTPEDEEP
jgi:uncharacterized protein (TIGR02300 family)